MQIEVTNAIARTDKLAVLTSIGLDHQEVLGETSPEIAVQKAGILAEMRPQCSSPSAAPVSPVRARDGSSRQKDLPFLAHVVGYSRYHQVNRSGCFSASSRIFASSLAKNFVWPHCRHRIALNVDSGRAHSVRAFGCTPTW
ncbi:hypothetical protein AB0I53_09020 [Saccharopolyspora sp. NPDC050389]|uniref:hypothetical protein n=1 Tax=Saccharopolyspora sp. NPDC050389 TaxID=3155516 RepID=UPI0033C88744